MRQAGIGAVCLLGGTKLTTVNVGNATVLCYSTITLLARFHPSWVGYRLYAAAGTKVSWCTILQRRRRPHFRFRIFRAPPYQRMRSWAVKSMPWMEQPSIDCRFSQPATPLLSAISPDCCRKSIFIWSHYAYVGCTDGRMRVGGFGVPRYYTLEHASGRDYRG